MAVLLVSPANNHLCLDVNRKKVICWNCRGAGSGEFACEMREIMKEHRPRVIVLLEPRIRRETTVVVCKKLGKKK